LTFFLQVQDSVKNGYGGRRACSVGFLYSVTCAAQLKDEPMESYHFYRMASIRKKTLLLASFSQGFQPNQLQSC